jgi:MerR family mercuric resistance operon transcriptional regulator
MTSVPAAAGLRSGQVAEAAGVNLQTLRYYERRGLLAEPERTPGGHRLYPSEAVTVLRAIKAAQRLGFTLDEIADLLEAGRHRHGRRADAGLHARARHKLADVEARIADLTVIADMLRSALAYGCDDLIDCACSPDCPIPFAVLTLGGPSPIGGPDSLGGPDPLGQHGSADRAGARP